MFASTTFALTAVAIAMCHAEIPHEMKTLMNTNINPCTDFYGYACGNWLESHRLGPSDVQKDSSFQKIDDNNQPLFTEIIKKNHPLLGELWDSCITTYTITKRGNEPLLNDVQRIAKAQSRSDILELAGDFFRTGTNAFTTFNMVPDIKDSKVNTLYVSSAGLTLPSTDYYFDSKFAAISREYHSYINELFELSGIDISSGQLQLSAADTVIDIERQLALIERQENGPTYRMKISQAVEEWPIALGSFFKGVGLLERTTVNDDFKIYIQRTKYFTSLNKWLNSIAINKLKVYLAFVMIHSRVQWLDKTFYDAWFWFFGKKIDGQQRLQPRRDFCLTKVMQYMPDLFGRYYTEKALDKKQEQDALKMVKYIKEAMGERISVSSWLGEKDKAEAMAKLDKILPLIGQSSVSQSYPNDLSRVNFPFNIYSILSHSFDAQMKKVGQPVNFMEWTKSPANANAFYSLRENTILLPTAILQPPLFSGQSVHPARNFGAIGTIIGHELTHGFDKTGNLFDSEGNARRWWSETAASAFNHHAQRMSDQYSAFKVYGEHGFLGKVNGNLTLDENIADNGGVTLAWDAYRKYMTSTKPESEDDGDKIFFLAFGQTWCTNTRDEAIRKLLVKDTHSPPKWRVNGALMNNEDFAKTFNCPIETRMNPSSKIRIW